VTGFFLMAGIQIFAAELDLGMNTIFKGKIDPFEEHEIGNINVNKTHDWLNAWTKDQCLQAAQKSPDARRPKS